MTWHLSSPEIFDKPMHWMSRTFIAVLVVVLSAIPSVAEQVAVVSTRTIFPGEEIEAADLKSVDLIRQPQIRYRFVTDFGELIGMVATRTILPGRFIRSGSTRLPHLIKAGAVTKVTYSNGSLTIVMECIALSNASAGDTIRLRNQSSGKILNGTVRADATVRVTTL